MNRPTTPRLVLAATLLAACAAHADFTDFEGFTTGQSVNGQGGWTVEDSWGHDPIDAGKPAPFDEAVVDDGTGNLAWRVSNAVAYTEYGFQPFGPVSNAVAGETGSWLYNDYGPDHTHPHSPPEPGAPATYDRFLGSFDFWSATGAAQPDLAVTLSPSAKQSSVRMSYLRIADNGTDGFDLLFYDVANGANEWNGTTIATGLSYSDKHSIAMDIQFVDGVVDHGGGDIDGNDIVDVYVDGALAHTGTTWEVYYYVEGEGVPEPRLQAVDSLLFRVNAAEPDTLGAGFFFDNLNTVAPMDPVADAGGPYRILVGSDCGLDGRCCCDPDGGDIVSYLWHIGSLSIDTSTPECVVPWAELAGHGVCGNGCYPVTLTITDNEGVTAFAETTLTVMPEPTSLALLGGTVAGLLMRRRRR